MKKTFYRTARILSRRKPLLYLWIMWQRARDRYFEKIASLQKQKTVMEYAKAFDTDILIETGTYLGDMVYAVASNFKEIYSIELDEKLARAAHNRFKRRNNVHIVSGDSSKMLPALLLKMGRPCLFWLDAHYSGGITAKGGQYTPVMHELGLIFNHPVKNHVILIDDAGSFTGKDNYPTIEEVVNLLKELAPQYSLEAKDNIIRILPPSSAVLKK